MGSSETSEELDSLEATAVKDKEDWQEESLPPGSAKLLVMGITLPLYL